MSERKLLEEFDWEVTERPFASPTPVIGGLIVRFRELWMSLAARWYIRPLLAQQNQFNRQLLLHLQKMEAHFDDNETRLIEQDKAHSQLLHDTAEMTTQLIQMNRLLQGMEARLAKLEGNQNTG